MALIVENTYQLTLNGTIGSHNWANVFHVMPAGAGAPTVVEAAESLFDAYVQEMGNNISDFVKMDSVSYVDLSSATGDSGTWFPTAQQAGSESSQSVPPQVSVLVSWLATGGRAQRNGRSYIPGVNEAVVDSFGALSGAAQTAWQSNVDLFLDALQTADLIPVVVSRTSPSTGVARTILGGAVQLQTATQRRRSRR